MEKLKLFDDYDEDLNDQDLHDQDVEFKDKIFGDGKQKLSEIKTAKLIELKSLWAHDPRFKIDERFVEDDDDDDKSNQDDDDRKRSKSEVEMEKEKNLSILEQVIGKPSGGKSENCNNSFQKRFHRDSSKNSPSLFTPRFDPSKEECKIFELNCNQEDLSSCQKRKRVATFDLDEIDQKIEEQKKRQLMKSDDSAPSDEKFNVQGSKLNQDNDDCYYEVCKNLKGLFAGQTENFTFGSSILDEQFSDIKQDRNDSNDISTTVKSQKYPTKNLLRYNSNKIEKNDNDREDKIKITESDICKSYQPISSFGFFFDFKDSRLNCTEVEDQFFTPELVKKVQERAQERQLQMIRALSLRKKSSMKNKRTEEKYTAKQKLHKKFIVQQKRKRALFRLNHLRNKSSMRISFNNKNVK